MKKRLFIILLFFFSFTMFTGTRVSAQCSVCTRSAQQLGEKPAKGMNTGIIYLAFAPFAIVGYIFYRWHKNEQV